MAFQRAAIWKYPCVEGKYFSYCWLRCLLLCRGSRWFVFCLGRLGEAAQCLRRARSRCVRRNDEVFRGECFVGVGKLNLEVVRMLRSVLTAPLSSQKFSPVLFTAGCLKKRCSSVPATRCGMPGLGRGTARLCQGNASSG